MLAEKPSTQVSFSQICPRFAINNLKRNWTLQLGPRGGQRRVWSESGEVATVLGRRSGGEDHMLTRTRLVAGIGAGRPAVSWGGGDWRRTPQERLLRRVLGRGKIRGDADDSIRS